MKYSIGIISDLYTAGLTEDGIEYHAEVYYIVAESPDGSRLFYNPRTFPGCRREDGVDYDGYSFISFHDIRAEAKSNAEFYRDKIVEGLNSGKDLTPELWSYMEPAYGSNAYIREHGLNRLAQGKAS